MMRYSSLQRSAYAPKRARGVPDLSHPYLDAKERIDAARIAIQRANLSGSKAHANAARWAVKAAKWAAADARRKGDASPAELKKLRTAIAALSKGQKEAAGHSYRPNPRGKRAFKVGDIVRYTTKFLRSTGQYASNRINGKVVSVRPAGKGWFAGSPEVVWNDDPDQRPQLVLAVNVELDPRARRRNKGYRTNGRRR